MTPAPRRPIPSAQFWSGRRVLITGHTGFKGAWLTLWLEALGADVTGLALAPEDVEGAYCAFEGSVTPFAGAVDLRDAGGVHGVVARTDPEIVLHLAAQPLVRRAYADPVGTYATNVVGTAILLDALRAAPSLRTVVVATSDKVYENDGTGRSFRETDRVGGKDPYSSSKACVEVLVSSWRSSFVTPAGAGLPAIATGRAGNVIGGGDTSVDRLLPDIRRALRAGEPVRLRYPGAIRPWQFVLEPLLGYVLLAERLTDDPQGGPFAVNFGPDRADELPVHAVVDATLGAWGSGRRETDPTPQPPEAAALQLDVSLARETLGWAPRVPLVDAIEWTVAWWRAEAAREDLRELALGQIKRFEDLTPA